MILFYDQLPEMREAKRREAQNREREFTGRRHDICGIRIRSMSLRDHLILSEMRHPLIHRRVPNQKELCFFLWILSDAVAKWHDEVGWRKQWFLARKLEWCESFLHGRRCRRALRLRDLTREDFQLTDEHPLAIATLRAFEYIDAMFADCPIASGGKGGESYFSYLANWTDLIRSEYKCTEEEVFTMPLPKLWQIIRAIRKRKDPNATFTNPETRKVKKKLLEAVRSKKATLQDFASGKAKLN